MKELISPAQSETFVVLASILLALAAGFGGYRAFGNRGILAALCGPLIWTLWQAHKWLTRFDPQSGYFGLQSVKVLCVEIIGFVVLGAALGWIWNKLFARGDAETQRDL